MFGSFIIEESKSSSNPISTLLFAGIIALVVDRLFWYGVLDGGAVSAILFVIIIRPAIFQLFLYSGLHLKRRTTRHQTKERYLVNTPHLQKD